MIIKPPNYDLKLEHARVETLKAIMQLTEETSEDPEIFYSSLCIAERIPKHKDFGEIGGSDIKRLLDNEKAFLIYSFFQTSNPKKAFPGRRFKLEKAKELAQRLKPFE
jgi:hypothetical protein